MEIHHEFGSEQGFFFFSSVADVAVKDRSLHERAAKTLYKDTKSLKSADRLNQNNENHNHTKSDGPARLVFRQRKQGKQQNNTKTKPKTGAQTKQPPSISCWTQWVTIKNLQIKRITGEARICVSNFSYLLGPKNRPFGVTGRSKSHPNDHLLDS